MANKVCQMFLQVHGPANWCCPKMILKHTLNQKILMHFIKKSDSMISIQYTAEIILITSSVVFNHLKNLITPKL